MKCSQCGNELKSGQKFCTKCGKKIEINENLKENERRYTEKEDKQLRVCMLILYSIAAIPLLFIGGFNLLVILGVAFCFGLIYIETQVTNLLFKCPNCKDDIVLNIRRLTMINDSKSRCNCPKCNKELLFNTKEKIVSINSSIERTENSNSSTSKLEELYNLKTKGIITEEEFESKKKEFLDKM